MTSIPSEQLAVLSTKESETLQTFPVPSPGPGEVLIKVESVGLNPVDYYLRERGLFVTVWPAILGCDKSGVIAAIGEGVEGWKVGDKV